MVTGGEARVGLPAPHGGERQGTPRPGGQQGREGPRRDGFTVADLLTLSRLPLALLFFVIGSPGARLGILALAAATDLLDGFLARRLGGSRWGVFLDPVADKLFMLSGFLVVATSGLLTWYEILGALLRDLVATVAFVVVLLTDRPLAIPARVGGKAVTLVQVLALLAFLLDSPLVRPLVWAVAAISLYAIYDYSRVQGAEKRAVGT